MWSVKPNFKQGVIYLFDLQLFGGKGPEGSTYSTTTFQETPNQNYSPGYDTFVPYKYSTNPGTGQTSPWVLNNNNQFTYYDNQGNKSFNAPNGGKGNLPTVRQPVTTYYDKDGKQVAQMSGTSSFSTSGKGRLPADYDRKPQPADQYIDPNTSQGSYLNN